MAGLNDHLKVTNFLLDKMKAFEAPGGKPILHVYFDPADVPTAGWGSIKGLTPAMARVQKSITMGEAITWFARDVEEAADAVRKYVKVRLTQPMFEALVDFTFNLGAGALSKSTLLKRLNAGDYDAVPDQIRRWNKARVGGKLTVLNGLVKRREWEAQRWGSAAQGHDTPAYSGTATVIPASPETTLAGIIVSFILSLLPGK